MYKEWCDKEMSQMRYNILYSLYPKIVDVLDLDMEIKQE